MSANIARKTSVSYNDDAGMHVKGALKAIVLLFLLLFVPLHANASDYTITRENNNIVVTVIPSDRYISYIAFLQTSNGVIKRELHSRRTKFLGLAQHSIAVQIVGEGVHGPTVLFIRVFRKQPLSPWLGTFEKSINGLRKQYNLPPLISDKTLAPAADNALARTSNGQLRHYTAKDGSIRQTAVRRKVLGENLYSAHSKKEAWKLLQHSPSHLYNLINPRYTAFFTKEHTIQNFHVGVIIFAGK